MDYSKFYWDQIRALVIGTLKRFGDENESYSFMRVCSSLILGVDYELTDEIIVDGGNDLGADAIFFDVDEINRRFKLFVIQCKYNKTSCEKGIYDQNLPEEVSNKFKNIFDYFATESCEQNFVNNDLKLKKEEYLEYINEGYVLGEIYFIACNLGKGLADNSRELWEMWYQKNPYRDKIILEEYGLERLFEKLQEEKVTAIDDTIKLFGRYFEYTAPDTKGLIGNITGTELARLESKFENKLFQKNIRYFLGDNTINGKIKETAKKIEARDKFWFLNNGITIVCKHYEPTGPGQENIKVKLHNFQIVNGAQTTKSISDVFKNIQNLDEVKILVKIYKADDKLANMITESTNSQNPVNKRDLKANDKIQLLIAESLKERGYKYIRKRGESITDKNIIDNIKIAQTFYAFYHEKPAEARNQKAKLFADDGTYNSIFNEKLTPEIIIFLHNSFENLNTTLRNIKRSWQKENSSKEKNDILQRSKFHIMYAFRKYFEEKGEDIYSRKFLGKDVQDIFSNVNTINNIIDMIYDCAQELIDEKNLNIVKVFQRKELTDKIDERIKKKIKIEH